MQSDEKIAVIREKYQALSLSMNERLKRLWAASEARALGRGGITTVANATGLSRTTIHAGLKELGDTAPSEPAEWYWSRRRGGGRQRLSEQYPKLIDALNRLIEPTTRGDPRSPLRWVSKSTRHLADALTAQGYEISHTTVSDLLHELDYSLQADRKVREGASHPDRDAQFHYINKRVKAFQRTHQPVISVDTKKKELIGDFYNRGREWQPKGHPEKVRSHDFPDKVLGKAIPYGVYDLTLNEGWVSVGIDHDTAEFAVESIQRWWRKMGSGVYPQAKRLLITADSGGSNSARSRLWKIALQGLANKTRLQIQVCHYPPGTSKWNKIEHRMFCHITENWRGRPLLSRAVVVNLIGHTSTREGLRIKAAIDAKAYPTGISVSDEQLAKVNLKKDEFHGSWNYRISPQRS